MKVTELIPKYMELLESKGKKASTRKTSATQTVLQIRRVVRHFLMWAWAEKYIPGVPLPKDEKERMKRKPRLEKKAKPATEQPATSENDDAQEASEVDGDE